MHVLTVLDHPNKASFTAAAARHFMDGARAAGHSVELADLNAEGFDPRWTQADVDEDMAALPDIRAEQERIARADAICLAFPLFWWGMPAMTKGWVDRVWTWGWAYDQLGEREVSLQRNRTGVLLVPAGGNSDDIAKEGYLDALETAWLKGTFGYFGLKPRRLEILYGATGSQKRREALLERSYDIGRTLSEPD